MSAHPVRSAQEAVHIKPLEWTECASPKGTLVAVSVSGDYVIRAADNNTVRLSVPETSGWMRHKNVAEAKDAAQSAHEQRVRSALLPPGGETATPPAPVQNLDGLREALIELVSQAQSIGQHLVYNAPTTEFSAAIERAQAALAMEVAPDE